MPMGPIVLSRRAIRDLRHIGRGGSLLAIQRALQALASDDPNLDIKALAGVAPWRRLRVAEYRVIFRAVDHSGDPGADTRFLVARVVHRRDLERAVATLR